MAAELDRMYREYLERELLGTFRGLETSTLAEGFVMTCGTHWEEVWVDTLFVFVLLLPGGGEV